MTIMYIKSKLVISIQYCYLYFNFYDHNSNS